MYQEFELGFFCCMLWRHGWPFIVFTNAKEIKSVLWSIGQFGFYSLKRDPFDSPHTHTRSPFTKKSFFIAFFTLCPILVTIQQDFHLFWAEAKKKRYCKKIASTDGCLYISKMMYVFSTICFSNKIRCEQQKAIKKKRYSKATLVVFKLLKADTTAKSCATVEMKIFFANVVLLFLFRISSSFFCCCCCRNTFSTQLFPY